MMLNVTYLISVLLVSVCVICQCNAQEDDQVDPCKEEDYRYELTECDAENGRWRVKLPSFGVCQDTTPSPATRINNCKISCEPGQYFDLGDLSCRLCRSGTYSLGGALLFDYWDDLPEGFSTQVESFQSSFSSFGSKNVDVNCSRYGWKPSGSFIESLGGPCAATLTFTIHLVKPGNLSYTYQYTDKDIIFYFEAQNDKCHYIGNSNEYRWPPATKEGEKNTQIVYLNTGQYVLKWKTIGMDLHQAKPVMIKSIEISGAALMSSCTECIAGTYSEGGARLCKECPENTYSTRESASCIPCDNITHYSRKGSSECVLRYPCTHKDYYETRTPCDSNNQTQKVYNWLEPKICRDDLPEAVSLPSASKKHQCPPCNPGMRHSSEMNCEFCPKNTFSNGRTGCRACPPNTTPNYGYQIESWSEMPPMMNTACMEPDGSLCDNNSGWHCNGSYIYSSQHHKNGVCLLLTMSVNGFRSTGGTSGGRHLEIGHVSFTFDLNCKSKCELRFMEGSSSQRISNIQSWSESLPRTEFIHPVMVNDSYTFSWAFQTLGQEEVNNSDDTDIDIVKIYSVIVTNTIDGGASVCSPCHQESEEEGCYPCPQGHYIDEDNPVCIPCPPNTTVSDVLAYGEKSCQPCGPGLRSSNGIFCATDCIFSFNGIQYDLRSLSNTFTVKGSKLFTASGAQYYHLFNISLCNKSAAICANNVSYFVQGQNAEVKSFVCRTTVIPSQWSGEGITVSTQAVSLGDELTGVTMDNSFGHMKVIDEFVKLGHEEDLHFYYSTPLSTRSCPLGRTTIITLHCDPDKKGNGTVFLPTSCPDGTCDGCNFNFFWSTEKACPVCTEDDFRIVKGECVDGVQTLHYIPPVHCTMEQKSITSRNVTCITHVPLELQVIIIIIIVFVLFLTASIIYFWKKSQTLEYKYMKLVQSSNNQEIELPPAESCALDDGDEEEIQTNSINQGILNRIKFIGKNKKKEQLHDLIPLTT